MGILFDRLSEARRSALTDAGLLVLRVTVGLMMALGHGWPKLARFAELSTRFADPLGVGSPTSLGLAIFAELFCSIALVLGLLTRAAAVPLIVTMLVAAFVIHGDDPWSKKEMALMYLVPYVVLAIAGPGRHSLDRVLGRRLAPLPS